MTELRNDNERIDLLERQLDRERRARRESETIAERGLRELWRANQSLDTRVAERTKALDESFQDASAAVRARESFLAHLGNEIGTPLHAALGNLELVGVSDLSNEDQERLTTVRRSFHRLADLLEGLMTLTSSEGPSNRGSWRMLSPTEFLDELNQQWQRPLATRGQLLVAELVGKTAPLSADWHRLGRVADVLLDNVVKHASAGRVVVSLSVVPAALVLEVTDSGPGIPGDMSELVMEAFFRIDADPGSAKGGAGVGLAVARRLLESAGGSLELTSGRQTRVVATLPAAISATGGG